MNLEGRSRKENIFLFGSEAREGSDIDGCARDDTVEVSNACLDVKWERKDHGIRKAQNVN